MADILVYATHFDRLKALIKWYNASTNVSVRKTIIKAAKACIEEIGIALDVTRPTDVDAVLVALALAMERDGDTILTRDVEIAAADITATQIDASDNPQANIGDGVLIFTMIRNDYLAVDERAFYETMSAICTGGVAGKEAFQLQGVKAAVAGELPIGGSGRSVSLRTAGESLKNWQFDNWSTDTAPEATNWTLSTGVWGTAALQEATIMHRGDYALELALTNDVYLYQSITPVPKANTLWAMGFWARKATGATGTIKVGLFESDGTEIDVYTLDVSTLSDSAWTFVTDTFLIPANAPSTIHFAIDRSIAGTGLTYLDSIQCTKMTNQNNIAFAFFAGATDFGIGDSFGGGSTGSDALGFTVQNEAAGDDGIIQTFLATVFNQQLPSSDAPTITDPS